ncbi:urea ABC transporter ATP-binding subunit UrtE [Acerihabitans sp. TG2]|uniref:urea ABC transporter ATP-binding subunit UrtE n=1 Tax=Acerihabitans sp. TG2 TaxID=3096008 RepID=UPI002B2303A4|nr:urea ABC transporter ATP-binding subunit UrtE [Acerihabitans sp. TG2]MEA9389247.1 urea ABC transporter ATP-binding subunit UrtE [Acerihabitans sp. TG2]
MLHIENYHVAYGQSRIIENLNIQVQENEIVALIGRNGMGKTTLMKSLIGMIPAQSGRVLLQGQDLSTRKSYQRVRAGMGFVPQGRMVFSTMTVEDNIKTGLPPKEKGRIPASLYATFPVLEEMKGRLAGNLSGGQQQQLVIARALAGNPQLLLLDEPTEGIQPSIIKDMARMLRNIRDQQGLTIVVSEQVLSFVMDVADRILVIEKGAIVHQENRQTIDQHTIAAYLSV